MPSPSKSIKLNPLQRKTLAILQQLARASGVDEATIGDDGLRLSTILPTHGNHVHIGDGVVMTSDATGLRNPAVFVALERKGLVRDSVPGATTLTAEGLAFDTGVFDSVIHRSTH